LNIFLSSTFRDLIRERKAVLDALHKKSASTLAMEYFVATPATPRETALEKLRASDVMVLVIGFKAGTLLPNGSGSTYTSAEYDELLRLGRQPLVFVKQKPRGKLGRPASWQNDEQDPEKKVALDSFKQRACETSTPAYFTTPDGLALAVIQALDEWEARGRPGSRVTFDSTEEYFRGKSSAHQFHILDFSTTLLGRGEQLRALSDFAKSDTKRVCILSGRGGIGKSKILYDWANLNPVDTVFLKDEPLWNEDSEKEIPVRCKILIVDDAHRQEALGRVLQLIQDTAGHRNLKLIVSTRPGSATPLLQQVLRKIDGAQVLQLPELQELNREQSRALAEEVLGTDLRNFAARLAEIGSNSPLVIVAGGRLITSRKIDPSTLTTLQEFRSTIFNRLLDEMDLQGPKFAIDPRPLLHLIAALGPVDVEQHEFQQSAQNLLGRRVDEILTTIDSLASNGIITPRPKPVRVLPDVLSDYLLEDCCISAMGRSTRYADQVYEFFGAHSLKNLMRNLAELDWRRSQPRESGLNLLNEIWADIYQRFQAGDEYERHRILTDISGGAIYQPDHVMGLVRTAIDHPVKLDPSPEGSQYRAGQDYVLSAVPTLLEATAFHPGRLRESVAILWEIASKETDRSTSADSAKAVLKRLASWHRFGDPALNFAMLVQAVHLSQRADAFTGDFTPFTLIEQILEREGEFNEWQDEITMSFGGFGLNYAAVGPVRESALDYLDYALDGDGNPAFHSVSLMQDLLRHFLNRVGRRSTKEEDEWQNRERERCLNALLRRYERPGSPLLKAKIYNALRSATAINCPEPTRKRATAALGNIVVDDAVAVVDAICTEEYQLPTLSTEFTEAGWEKPITELMMKGRSSLERLASGAGNQARFTIDQTQACIEVRVKTGGFHRFMLAFADRPDFLVEMADQLSSHPQIAQMVGHLSSVLNSIHVSDAVTFRQRALSALQSGAIHIIHASANNLRVFEGATEEDIAVIQAYAGYPDPIAKQGAIFAITYMGKFTELRQNLKDAVLSVHTDGNQVIAAYLADAFGPYGVPLTSLTRDEAAAVASEFLPVRDWEFAQGAIPRFLTRFVNLFPDETYTLLFNRIERDIRAREENGGASLRSFGLVHSNISFGGVPAEKRLQLGQHCITRLIASRSAGELADLFWIVAGFDEPALRLIVETAANVDEKGFRNIETLIGKAIPRLAFSNTRFTRDLLQHFTGGRRERLVEAIASQARSFRGGVFAGDPGDYMAQRNKQFADLVAGFPYEPGLEDLAKALRRFT
jgi:hypothetical protein